MLDFCFTDCRYQISKTLYLCFHVYLIQNVICIHQDLLRNQNIQPLSTPAAYPASYVPLSFSGPVFLLTTGRRTDKGLWEVVPHRDCPADILLDAVSYHNCGSHFITLVTYAVHQ